jgi:CheY-like chemotaxis protein
VGTEFVFTVGYKIAYDKTDVAPSLDKAIVARRDTAATLSGRVLLAEDNPVNQKLAVFILKKWGIDFDIASNGAAACIMLRGGDYDLVLMDIQMPEMDGYQATKIIREEMKLRLPIVALTAHAFEGEIEGFTRAGMDGYITKPFKEDDLYDVLAHFLPIPPKLENGFHEVKKASPAVTQVIDFTEVEKISGGNKLFVKELAEIFVSQVQTELEQLEDAFAKKDTKNLNGVAHSMKGTVAYMGLMSKLDDPLHRIETCVESDLTGITLSDDIAYIRAVCLDAVKQLEIELPEYI